MSERRERLGYVLWFLRIDSGLLTGKHHSNEKSITAMVR
jgi:hypothetical protein